MPEDLLPVLLF